MPNFSVFISYAREDEKKASALYHGLKKKGLNPWMDMEKLRHGDDWEEKIKTHINSSDFYIPLLSQHSLARKVESGFGFEIQCALRKSEKAPARRFILPVRIEDCDTDDARLKKLHWIDLLSDFDQALEKLLDTFEHESKENWNAIKMVAAKITRQSMEHRSERYKRHPSIERKELLKNIKDFLESDKRIFVITGKSGVGKTTFIINLLENWPSETETCFFVFDARKIESESFIDFVNSKFFNHVQSLEDEYEDFKDRIGKINFIPHIDKLPIVHSNQMVFIIDGINEIVNGNKLLKDIDKLIGEIWQERLFLKIILTSRPEAWKSILKNALPTSIKHFYRPQGTDDDAFSLEAFSIKAQNNEPSETEEAFNQYKERWGIRTHFYQLSDALKNLLKDPLIMALVSEIYKNDFIPFQIDLDDIYLRYFTMLVRREKINQNAFKLIKECVAKAMTEPEYTNELRATILDDDEYFTELLCKGRFSTFQERKQIRDLVQELISNTFVVVDATDTGYVMRFGLERFYDYFIGNYLSSSTDDDEQFFALLQNIGTELREKPFLWGPACRAVELKLHDILKVKTSRTDRDSKYSLIKRFLELTEESIQEVVAAAFVDVFAKYPGSTVTLLTDVIADYRNRGGTLYWLIAGKGGPAAMKIKRLLGIIYRIVLNADQVRLQKEQVHSIGNIFQLAIIHFPSDVRYAALTFLYHLNNEHSYLVNQVAEGLKTNLISNLALNTFFVVPKIIRFRNMTQGFAMLSVFRWGKGFFDEIQNQTMDKENFQKSIDQFKEILRIIYGPKTRFGKVLKGMVRFVFQLFIKHQIIKTYKNKDNPCNYYEIELLLKEIKKDPALKKQVQQIARFFDTSKSDITEDQAEMIKLCNISNGLTSWYLYSIIPLHFKIPDRQEKIMTLIEALCHSENCNPVGKLIGLNALLTLITRISDVIKDKKRQEELMALYMSTAHHYILQNGAFTHFDISSNKTGKQTGRQWANSVPGEFHLLTKYNERVSGVKSKGSALLSILLAGRNSDEDLLKCTEIVCNFVNISDVFKMTDTALEELKNLVDVLEKHFFKSPEIKEKIRTYIGKALKEIKGHDPARAALFIDNYLAKSDIFKPLEQIKLESAESAGLYRTVGIIGNSVYQNVFLMYDEIAELFSKATLQAIEKKNVSRFFQVYLNELSEWTENQLIKP
jgi:hypothetical protein